MLTVYICTYILRRLAGWLVGLGRKLAYLLRTVDGGSGRQKKHRGSYYLWYHVAQSRAKILGLTDLMPDFDASNPYSGSLVFTQRRQPAARDGEEAVPSS